MHSPCLLVWVLALLFDDDLIHLFVEDEIFECRLQIVNVTSLLTEVTFTQMLKLEQRHILFDVLITSVVGILVLNDLPHNFL